MKKSYLTSFFLAVVLFTSCMPDVDTDKFSDFTYNGEWGIPVINASVTLADVLADDTLFTVDPDGGLRIVYQQDSLIGFTIEDFASVPEQPPVETAVPLDIPSLSISSSLGTFGGAKFKQFGIADGKLNLEVENNLSDTVELQVVINNATIAGQVFQVNVVAPVGTSSTEVVVAGLDLDLSNNNTTENYLSFDINVVDNGGAQPGESVTLRLTYQELKVQSAVGYFGQRSVNIPSGNIPLAVGAFENFLDGLYLDNPTINLKFITNIGLPLQLDVDMDGINSYGDVEPLGLGAININGPSVIGDYDTSNVIIDNTTSNIVDFIANVPSTILYSGQGVINPQGETGVDNFVTADGAMVAGLMIDLPLDLRTQNLTFQQELNDIDFGGLSEQAESVEKLTLLFNVENEFPFDADLKLEFFDANNVLTDSVNLALFEAAPVDANGRSTGYKITTEEETLSGAKIERLLGAEKILMTITLNTTNNGNTTVTIYEDYDILVRLAVKAKLNYEL